MGLGIDLIGVPSGRGFCCLGSFFGGFFMTFMAFFMAFIAST